MKLGQLRQLIAEEAKRALIKETSDTLNHLIGFADVFANLPRHIRLDILRVVEGEFDKVNPQNIKQSLDVLHGLNPELDQALEAYIDHAAPDGQDQVAAEGTDPGTQGHDEGEDEDEETRNHPEDWRVGEGHDPGTQGHDEDEDEDEETLNEVDLDDDFGSDGDSVTEDKHFGGTQYITNPWADGQKVNKKGETPKPKKKSFGPCEGTDPGTQGHDEGEDEDEETRNHPEDWRIDEDSEELDEVAPPGWEGTVKAMKKHKNIKNPWALAWSEKNKGYKSHKKS